ncbi:hypothetical protein FACS1894211_06700 [Clostridia bacterium]|nr:hypothetical protein FACS1894211_06700 [Clostridia bacterium]
MSSETVKIFLIDGSISGMVTAEIMNWTGHVIAAPFSRLDDLKKRDELKRSGVYILLGENKAYIGEAETIVERWRDPKHEIFTDKYDKVIVVTSKDQNLTKGHIKYIEAKLLELGEKAKRTTLENRTSQQKQLHNLPESDISDMENFLQKLSVVLPTIGVEIFKQTKDKTVEESTGEKSKVNSPVFEYKGKGFASTAQIIDDEFTLLEGSKLRKKWEGVSKVHGDARKALIEKGVILDDGETLTLTQNFGFSSPSYAASVVGGFENVSGPAVWKIQGSTKTYKEWIEEKLTTD